MKLKENADIGFALRSILPSEISRSMLRKPIDIYNLNEMSHDATITLIRKIVENGKVKVKTAFIDTVGNPNSYKRKLEREFPGIQFVVESKADANYAPCSAASVGKTKKKYPCKITATKSRALKLDCRLSYLSQKKFLIFLYLYIHPIRK